VHISTENLQNLQRKITGELLFDSLHRRLYSTDASIYQQEPLAVAYPKTKADIKALIKFAKTNGTSLIPRTAGTSLAGQCVGEGIVVDVSRHFTRILEINKEEGWVKVEPGVIRDELNRELAKVGLYFGPNTSTSNRCMMGGMLGNNSCGSTSIKYGTTRDHVLEVETILSDGSEASWKHWSEAELKEVKASETFQGKITNFLIDELTKENVQKEIESKFPDKLIHRRNTGYAVDVLIDQRPFSESGEDLNIGKLLAGSEGTLAFTTAIKLHVDPLPPAKEAVVCMHFMDLHECMEATVLAMESDPYQCELVDKIVLDATKANLAQAENRFFVEGDPAAILCVELRAETDDMLQAQVEQLSKRIKEAGFGYAFPVVYPPKTTGIWILRAAGLGLLSNVPGDAKPVAFVEDTAVALPDLPAYIREFEALMISHGQQAVYYAHAGAGELHLRPVLDLKTNEGRKELRTIAEDTAKLVKKYNGSLSGEHGDGRVRAEFIPMMVGEKNYELFRQIKRIWDPNNIFNPGKIVDAPPMDEDLRYEEGQLDPGITTFMDWSETEGILRAAEKCNGSGDCRKLPATAATMCPSYHATRNEKDTTRARANALRSILTEKGAHQPFDSEELKEVLELCLSCKGCKRECPSNVDMAAMKAEFSYQYQKKHGIPLRSKVFGHFQTLAALARPVAPLANAISNLPAVKRSLGIAEKRSLPKFTLWTGLSVAKKEVKFFKPSKPLKTVCLYIDEFTQYNDAHIAQKATELLCKLGYDVVPVYSPSGRAFLSKGMLEEAQKAAHRTLAKLAMAIGQGLPVVGLEPSGVLGFRDEYPKLVDKKYRAAADQLNGLAQTIEEFLAGEIEDGNIKSDQFTDEAKTIHLHLHCYQKALSHVRHSKRILRLPKNFTVKVIPSGCCGMAGSFGYEAEHYEVSMQVGEQVLFPRIREASKDDIIVASGTSCRHQILDGTGRGALHVVEVMVDELNLHCEDKIKKP
jgi:FAD/FMN-containing dehydrogenase/Fe-S oxidoreductase